MPTIRSRKGLPVFLLALALCSVAALAYWISSPGSEQAQLISHQDVTSWLKKLVDGAEVSFADNKQKAEARRVSSEPVLPGRPPPGVSIVSLGPLEKEQARVFERSMLLWVQSWERKATKLLQDTLNKDGALGASAMLNHAELAATAEEYRAAYALFKEGQYWTTRKGSPFPPIPSGMIARAFRGAASLRNEWVDILVLIDPSKFPNFKHALENRQFLKNLTLDDLIAKFNALPLTERQEAFLKQQSLRKELRVITKDRKLTDEQRRAKRRELAMGLLPRDVLIQRSYYLMTRRQ